MAILKEIIADSGVAFGTSGARGLVTQFTPEVCAAFAQSFIRSMRHRFNFSSVAIGIDNRPSSPDMAAACIGALQSLGVDVDYYGILPTPALALQAMREEIPAIMITGSHIPFDRNGIKFYRPDGEITKDDELSIISQLEPLLTFSASLPTENPAAANAYVSRYRRLYPCDLLKGKHVAIYEHSSAGRELYHQVFRALGATVTRLARSDQFVPIDTEAVSKEDQKMAKAWASEHQFDAIFSTDGDGDSPLLADENGDWWRGDILGLLAAKALGVDVVSLPVSCNTAIEQSGYFREVIRTKIGSPYVIEAFQLNALSKLKQAGFEANGGFLLASEIEINGQVLSSLPTRDALLPALAVLAMAEEAPLSSLLASLPAMATASERLQNYAPEHSRRLLDRVIVEPNWFLGEIGLSEMGAETDLTDGVRLLLSNGEIIHLRQSGNAPELRCYAQSNSKEQAEELVRVVLAWAKTYSQND